MILPTINRITYMHITYLYVKRYCFRAQFSHGYYSVCGICVLLRMRIVAMNLSNNTCMAPHTQRAMCWFVLRVVYVAFYLRFICVHRRSLPQSTLHISALCILLSLSDAEIRFHTLSTHLLLKWNDYHFYDYTLLERARKDKVNRTINLTL